MTDPDATSTIDQPRARRPRRSNRRHPALGARVAATGLSTATMFSIIAALGAQSTLPTTSPDVDAPTRIVVVDPLVSTPSAVTVSELSDQPVQLTATPVVRAAQPAPAQAVAAPVARTNGSR